MDWDWLTNFYWTPAELALAVPVGVILAGAISYFGARKGSKDLGKIQDRVIQSQKDLAQMQREHALFDKRSDAYVEMIRVLQTMPALPDGGSLHQFSEYNAKLIEWALAFQHAHAALLAFSQPAFYQKVQPFTTFVTKCTNAISGCIIELAEASQNLDETGASHFKEKSNAAYRKAAGYQNQLVRGSNMLMDLIRAQLFPELKVTKEAPDGLYE